MPDSSMNSQVLYGWAGDFEPVEVKTDAGTAKTVPLNAFQNALQSAEVSFGQKILQDNKEKLRILQVVQDAQLVASDPSTATTSQLATTLNSVLGVLTNLVVNGKSRG